MLSYKAGVMPDRVILLLIFVFKRYFIFYEKKHRKKAKKTDKNCQQGNNCANF